MSEAEMVEHLCEMMERTTSGFLRRRKRAVVLVGAGASIEYKASSTPILTAAIEQAVLSDSLMKQLHADAAFIKIKNGLQRYLSDPPNFEQIYHCLHELLSMQPPTANAADEFRPLLYPFIADCTGIAKQTLKSLIEKITSVIFEDFSASCANNTLSLAPLTAFISTLRKDHVTRIYTTNYDDFLLQAAPDSYRGFDQRSLRVPKRFDVDGFWHKLDLDAIFHLHGSVHMGFAAPRLVNGDIAELFWFNDRTEAAKYMSFSGSTRASLRMDGTSYLPTAVITGLDKLSRIQQRPFSHFYSAIARDMMLADVIYVIGSGLSDFHLNTWLSEARSRSPQVPLVFVDYWRNGFENDTYFEADGKSIALFHRLKVHISSTLRGTLIGSGWRITQDKTAAIWDKGFQAFLNAPGELQDVLGRLR